jgi:hypothetical protein
MKLPSPDPVEAHWPKLIIALYVCGWWVVARRLAGRSPVKVVAVTLALSLGVPAAVYLLNAILGHCCDGLAAFLLFCWAAIPVSLCPWPVFSWWVRH